MKALSFGVAVAILVMTLIITVKMNSGDGLVELTREKALMEGMDKSLRDSIEEQKREFSRWFRGER